MKIDLNHYLTVAQTEFQANWQPITAMVGIAIVVAAVWGKVALAGFVLASFVTYLALGPSFKVMTYLDMKGFLIVTLLFGNGYFGWVNPMYLNYYAGACMLAREWNFWRIYSDLSGARVEAQRLYADTKEVNNRWAAGIEDLDQRFRDLLQAAEVAAPIRQQLDARAGEVAIPIERNIQEIQERLDRLNDLAALVINNKALKERMELADKTRQDTSALRREHEAARVKYNSFMSELGTLNEQLAATLATLERQEALKAEQITILTRTIGNLRTLNA